MSFTRPLTLFVLTASFSFVFAKDKDQDRNKLCDAASASTADHDAGVIVQKLTLRGEWGRNDATVYLPEKEIAEAAIVFSHSSILAQGASTDLLPLALTLAHAGAAVIVPERSLLWPPTDQSTSRQGAVVVCAARWIMDHTKVFNNGMPVENDRNIVVSEGYAYVGPRVCDPTASSDCHFRIPFDTEAAALSRYYRHSAWVPVGETEGGDNTDRIISDGGLQAARWLQKNLGLAPIIALVADVSSSEP
jgi:hypothetical protein